MAGAAGVRFSVVSGGLLCLLGVAVIAVAFPALRHYDTHDWTSAPDGRAPGGAAEALQAVELT